MDATTQNLFQDQVAIITGGGAGIGKGIAQAVVGQGARVAIADVGRSTAESLAASMGVPGAMMTEIAVSRSGQVARSVNEVGERFGRVNILVNCAGWNLFMSPKTTQTCIGKGVV